MCVHILNLTSMAKAARHSLLLLFVGIWQDRQVLLATTDQDQPQSKTSHGTDQDEVRDRLQGGRVLAVIDEATRTTANSRGEKGGGGWGDVGAAATWGGQKGGLTALQAGHRLPARLPHPPPPRPHRPQRAWLAGPPDPSPPHHRLHPIHRFQQTRTLTTDPLEQQVNNSTWLTRPLCHSPLAPPTVRVCI